MILAAWALAGMVAGRVAAGSNPPKDPKPTIGLTMFGVTTPCVDAVRKRLDADGAETLVFHATGTGGRGECAFDFAYARVLGMCEFNTWGSFEQHSF